MKKIEDNNPLVFIVDVRANKRQITDAVRYARARLVRVNKASLMLGDTVRFHSVKRGVTMQGTVNKIAIKYVTVATQQGLWRVPANMLEAV